MFRKSLMAYASILLALAQVPTAIAAQNSGNNWPSRSCGCSTAGKCYVKFNHDKDFECLADGGAANACTGVCSFTNNPVDSVGGTVMRPKSSTTGGGGVLKQ
jgi:hypothetical protein